jgi:hypothetical protein
MENEKNKTKFDFQKISEIKVDNFTKTIIKADFSIQSNQIIDWDKVSDFLQIRPTKFYNKGDDHLDPKQNFKMRFSIWRVSTGYEETRDMDDTITPILDIFEPKIELLKQLKQLLNVHDLSYNLLLVIQVVAGATPAIHYESRCIDFLHEVGATTNIDLYVKYETDEENEYNRIKDNELIGELIPTGIFINDDGEFFEPDIIINKDEE